jgi:general secretion pathway protein B
VPEVRPLAAETEAGDDPALDRAEPARPPVPAAVRTTPPLVRAAPASRAVREQPYAAERAAAVREFRGGSNVAGLPSIHELPAPVIAGLPQLNLELHVYSAEPAQRFVIINGQRLHEGAQLKEGLTVEQIVQEGAILNHQGTRFLLPRE